MTESFILCIAKGGLVDFTTEIWACREYAIRHKRSLIIEKTHYREDLLGEVFDFTKWPIPVYFIDRLYSVVHTDIEPVEYREFLAYEGPLIKSFKICGGCLSFDMGRSYKNETLLVHCSLKRHNDLRFLRSVGYTSEFISFLREKMALLPVSYNVTHIRHTDWKVNLDPTYQYIKLLMSSSFLQLYVATDNTSVLKSLIETYGSRVLYNSSVLEQPSSMDGKPIHSAGPRFALHNAILDLFILARGANSVTEQYRATGSHAYGYTRLAELFRSHTSFIERLLV